MINIGSADIVINGTEDGERTISSPVIPKVNKSKLPLNKVSFPMSRAKGDNMSFGLRPDAKLRVLVHVNEPNVPVPSASDFEPEPQHDFPIKEVMESSVYDSPIKRSAEPIENKTDSNCTEDDYSPCDDNSTDEEIWEEYVVEDNELRHLREQLVKSENSNKILKQKIADCHDALQLENEKYDQFCYELEIVKQNADNTIESLREELHIARCEAVMLPVYETRISELLEELKIKDHALKRKDNEIKEKDDEIACLRDEIQEIRTGFRSQVDALSQVDSLLWDNDDQSTITSTTAQSQHSQLKTDQWLAANMKEEWTGLKNAIIRSSRKLTSKEGGAAAKSVKWNDEEKKSDDEKSTEEIDETGGDSNTSLTELGENVELVEENPTNVKEQQVLDDCLGLIEDELMSDEDAAAVSDEEA
jgi:response regulator of citrate/malate metabolism